LNLEDGTCSKACGEHDRGGANEDHWPDQPHPQLCPEGFLNDPLIHFIGACDERVKK